MEKVKIITDSCSDLPRNVREKHNIKMIATPVIIDGEEYKDREDLSPPEFYKKLTEIDSVPKTARISPDKFREEFEKALDEGYKVLSINFSSQLSGIFESAALAKKMIGSDKIKVIDSKSASTGFGLSVLKAARAAEEGKDLDEIVELTKKNCAHMEHIFAVGSLEMLKRGGRISSGKAFIGNVLNIKPILHFQDGEILPLTKVRGKKKMLQFLVDIIEERGINPQDQIIGIDYSANRQLAEQIKNMLQDRYGVEDFLISEIGAAIGSHVGHNTVSIFFLNKEKVADIEVI